MASLFDNLVDKVQTKIKEKIKEWFYGGFDMNKKIELIQNETISYFWHWVLLAWNGEIWHNVGSGLEKSYELAVEKAKEAYDNYETTKG